MDDKFKVGDVVCLASDIKTEMPMTVYFAGDKESVVYYIHPISKEIVRDKQFPNSMLIKILEPKK